MCNDRVQYTIIIIKSIVRSELFVLWWLQIYWLCLLSQCSTKLPCNHSTDMQYWTLLVKFTVSSSRFYFGFQTMMMIVTGVLSTWLKTGQSFAIVRWFAGLWSMEDDGGAVWFDGVGRSRSNYNKRWWETFIFFFFLPWHRCLAQHRRMVKGAFRWSFSRSNDEYSTYW